MKLSIERWRRKIIWQIDKDYFSEEEIDFLIIFMRLLINQRED